jgi:hydroxymethylbilane synthase
MGSINVGSRASQLARTQALWIVERLQQAHPGLEVRHRIVSTQGDRDRVTSLRALGATGIFTKELELDLFEHKIDLAIHSLKDVPTVLPPGLILGAVPAREEIRDALCGARLADLKPGARVGTGSPRRQAQLLHLRPDLEVVPLRGNVPTRLQRLKGSDKLDAVLLAAAGLNRLGYADHIAELLPLETFPPSPSQGALGLEIREEDVELHSQLAVLNDSEAAIAVRAERALLNELHGGCSVPVGAYGLVHNGILTLRAQVTSLDGSRVVIEELTQAVTDPDHPESIGRELARRLRDAGAGDILQSIRPAVDPVEPQALT